MNRPRLTKVLILCLVLAFSVASTAFTQGGTYLDDEGDSLWEEETFTDVTGQEFETVDRQYVGEEQIKAAEEAARKAGIPTLDIAAAIEKDKQLMPDNIIYGIGTGAVIGGWLALVQGQDARQNVQYLSIGILTGSLIGMLIGTKSLYLPSTQPISSIDENRLLGQNDNPHNFARLNPGNADSAGSPKLRIDFQFKF